MKVDELSTVITFDPFDKPLADRIRRQLTSLFRAAGIDASMKMTREGDEIQWRITVRRGADGF